MEKRSNRLREEMQRQGMTFSELAVLSGYSAGFLSRVASGDRGASPLAQYRIAKAIGAQATRLWSAPEVSDER